MKSRTLLRIAACFVFSVLTVIVLFVVSDDLIHAHNAFFRQFPPHTLTPGDTVDVEFNSYYIAGGTQHHIYLGNYTSPLNVIVVNTTTADTQQVVLQVKNIHALKVWALRLRVDSPYFFLSDGAVPVVFRGNVSDWRSDGVSGKTAYFIDATPMSNHSLAMRSVSSATNEFTLGKESITSPQVTLAPGLLQKQIDGRFCVDGMLHYDKAAARLVYLYYYRNQFIVADSSLKLLYRGKTIDTVSRAQIKIAGIASKMARTMAAPPLLVNKHSCLAGDWLLVDAGLMARNEKRTVFDKSSVIDVYSIADRRYHFSIYVPEYAGFKIRDMKVFGHTLVVLFDRYLLTYGLVPGHFDRK